MDICICNSFNMSMRAVSNILSWLTRVQPDYGVVIIGYNTRGCVRSGLWYNNHTFVISSVTPFSLFVLIAVFFFVFYNWHRVLCGWFLSPTHALPRNEHLHYICVHVLLSLVLVHLVFYDVLCSVQTASNGGRNRQILPVCSLLPGRGSSFG